MLLTEFAGPDAHAAVIETWIRLGLKGQTAVRAFCEPQRDGKVLPGFFSSSGLSIEGHDIRSSALDQPFDRGMHCLVPFDQIRTPKPIEISSASLS